MIHVFAFNKASGIDIQSYCCPDLASSYQYPHPYTIHVRRWPYTKTFKGGCVTPYVDDIQTLRYGTKSFLYPRALPSRNRLDSAWIHYVDSVPDIVVWTRWRCGRRRLWTCGFRVYRAKRRHLNRVRPQKGTRARRRQLPIRQEQRLQRKQEVRYTNWVTPFAILLCYINFQSKGFWDMWHMWPTH